MSKLRVVKERKERTGDFDQDLRGLGGTDLLANEYPWVFLSVKSPINNLKSVCDLLGLHVKPGQEQGILHIFKPGKNQNHKEKTLELFGASVLLAHSNPEVAMCLGQISVLAQKIQGVELKDIKEESSEDYSSWKKVPGLSSNETMRTYLEHAGISLLNSVQSNQKLVEMIRNQNTKKTLMINSKKTG